MPREEIASFSLSRLSILDEEGRVDPALEPDLSPEELLRLYRAMVLGREADGRMLKLQRQGRMGTFAPCTGQEAAHCAPAFAMSEKDWFVGAFREIGARLLRGEPLESSLLLYNGYEEGNAAPPGAERTLPVAVIIASQLVHAVGIGYAIKYRKQPETAVIAFFGDGGTSEGDFHEAMNFAGLWRVPVVFICQNNHWAISVPVASQSSSRTLAQKAIAYDIPALQVDGNDALAMYAATREALQRARSGGGPTLIEAVTYRMLMHTTADDPTKYRSDEEVQAWRSRDPLRRFRLYLESRGLWDAAAEEALLGELRKEVEEAVARFESRRDFKPDAPFDHVFGTRHESIEKQRALFLAETERDREEASHA